MKLKMLKVMYMGEPLCNIYPYANKFQVFKYKIAKWVYKKISTVSEIVRVWTKRSAYACVFAWMLVGAMLVGQHVAPEKIVEAEAKVIEVKGKSPIMEKIAKCESGGVHISKKTGQVVMRANTNGTVDVGKYQINSVWFKKAFELGLDVTKEEDNEKMAYWIYENRGTEDWYPSKACWQK